MGREPYAYGRSEKTRGCEVRCVSGDEGDGAVKGFTYGKSKTDPRLWDVVWFGNFMVLTESR